MMNKQNSRVFLIATPSVSSKGDFPKLEPLAEFGDIKVVVENGDYPSFKPAEIYKKVVDRLKMYDAENDYLVWAGGDTLAAFMAGSALAQMGHRSFRWLRFERGIDRETGRRTNERGKYTPIDIALFNPESTGTARVF